MYEMEGPQLGALRLSAGCPAYAAHVTLHCQGLVPAAPRGRPPCAARGLLRDWDRLGRE